jgi:N6-L-threonylcarbamoyladenine synthase
VAANSRLREKLMAACADIQVQLVYPVMELCTDNAAMIAEAAYFYLKAGKVSGFDINAVPYQKLV